ncbi:MAG: translocation/assembly module TamB [Muribaculaceae bacterium]|nr:translocation/assembly module TamB [Muribaculaceae bacterium]
MTDINKDPDNPADEPAPADIMPEDRQPDGDTPVKEPEKDSPDAKAPEKRKRRMSRWIKVPLWIIGCLIFMVVLIPVLLYVPPVQTFVKDVATKIVRDKTGMHIKIDHFRLKFPVDVSLGGVSVVEAGGDTMVNAKEAIASVKLLPLLHLDLQIKKLSLENGYYRFVSPDSSMVIKIRAGHLEVDDKSSMNLARSEILLNDGKISDGDVALYMNVWKQQPTPQDTTATPFLISAKRLDVERMRFAMSMLPTIDTLVMNADKMALRDGIINLRTNEITASLLTLDGGDARYVAPTPEYQAAHPVPVADSTAVGSPPMTIRADSISLDNFKALYAIKGAVPQPGFDPNYIEVTDVGIGLRNFYDRGADLRLPLTRVAAKERSGLQVVDAEGLVAINEAGLSLDALSVRTPFSTADLTVGLPFALMELNPSAPINARVTASLGIPDINAYMPSLKTYTSLLPGQPLNALIAADGRLDNVEIKALDVAMPTVFSLRASGRAQNALDLSKLVADLTIDGEIVNPAPVEKLAGGLPFKLPPLKIKGTAGADRETYRTDLSVITPKGDILADGHVGLNSEVYDVDLRVEGLDVAHFMPDLGVGDVTARVQANGAGFNPTLPRAHTDFDIHVASILYNGKRLRDITAGGMLSGQRYSIDLDSPNEDMNLKAHVVGTIKPDDYCAEGLLRIYNADLQEFGLMDNLCYGAADLEFDVTAKPDRWLYDATLDFHSISWHMEDLDLDLPQGVYADFVSEADNVHCYIEARGTSLTFDSPRGLKDVTEGFTKALDVAMKQIDARDLDVEEMQQLMPPFELTANASGNGLMADFLNPSGMAIDTVALHLANDSLIHGNVLARRLNTGSMTLDTLTLGLKERGKLFDYAFHMGNRPGVLDEFARVNVNGYLGSNRLSAFITQNNLAGKTGYRIGFTAAFADSTVSIHFTPLRSTIAYLPWTFNEDNHIDYDFTTRHVDANLKAASRESSLMVMTERNETGEEELHLNITNIHVEDFLQMSVIAPPVKATVDGDVRMAYDGKELNGKGNVSVHNLIYDGTAVGNFDLGLNAGVNIHGESVLDATLDINNDPAMGLHTILQQGATGLEPKTIDLSLTQFPLNVINAFLDSGTVSLSGALNGKMNVTGSLTEPLLNGEMGVDNVGIYIPMIGSSLKLESRPLTVVDNLITFDSFSVFGANNNPLTLNGQVNARQLSNISFDLTASAQNFQLINNDRRAKSDLFGKLFLNLNATVTGPMKHFDVNANLNVLGATDVTYNYIMDSSAITLGGNGEVVKFVNFADTTQVTKADTVPQMMAMRLRAGVTITQGAAVTVNLFQTGEQNGQVKAHPYGTINAFQNFMGDMTLNGQLFLGEGLVNYKVPLLGEKEFTFNPASYVLFNGNMLNPTLNIKATDNLKATVVNQSGNSNLVNFLIGVDISQTLSNPKVLFDLSTDDDLSLQNELQSMSPDQRSSQAMNLLLTGIYQGSGLKTSTGNFADNMLYGFLESTLNQWAANNIRGVDLSFGIDNYSNTVDGVSSNAMSYSYQVSKSLFNNRFKVVVGGNYSTDASADENFAQNLVSDVSFEYTIKQTNSLTMLAKLFRHVGYESVLEGEITEMGVGFVMRRRLARLNRLFRVNWGKKKTPAVIPDMPDEDGSRSSKSHGLDPANIREVRERMKQYTDSLRRATDEGTAVTEEGGDK